MNNENNNNSLSLQLISSVDLYIPGTQEDKGLQGTSGYQRPVATWDQWLPGTNDLQGPMASRDQGLPRTRVLLTWTRHSRGPVATRDQEAVDTAVDQLNKHC